MVTPRSHAIACPAAHFVAVQGGRCGGTLDSPDMEHGCGEVDVDHSRDTSSAARNPCRKVRTIMMGVAVTLAIALSGLDQGWARSWGRSHEDPIWTF
jgi:hypothetical protein